MMLPALTLTTSTQCIGMPRAAATLRANKRRKPEMSFATDPKSFPCMTIHACVGGGPILRTPELLPSKFSLPSACSSSMRAIHVKEAVLASALLLAAAAPCLLRAFAAALPPPATLCWPSVDKPSPLFNQSVAGGGAAFGGGGPAMGNASYASWIGGSSQFSSVAPIMRHSWNMTSGLPSRSSASRYGGNKSGNSAFTAAVTSLAFKSTWVHFARTPKHAAQSWATSAPVQLPDAELSNSMVRNLPFSSKRAELKRHMVTRMSRASISSFCWL
mmetsp:Transcript_55031/g.128740  ORF Transcript_55031/g.128740 Transcript_55031/m.128740 type:complete len:273 (-) Transcript_55031:351-1169(-)